MEEKRHILVCNDKGGVGKSLVSHLLGLILLDQREDFRVLECERRPRLQRVFGSLVEWLPTEEVNVGEVYTNPDRIFSHWDRLAEYLTGGDRSLVDMGAGMTSPFIRWSEASGHEMLEDGRRLIFAVVVTVERNALSTGKENIEMLRRMFPKARIVAVQNEKAGLFTKNIEEVNSVKLAGCRVPAWEYLQDEGRFDQVAMMSGREIAEKYDMSLGAAARSMYGFADWLLDATDSLAPILDPDTASNKITTTGSRV